MKQIKWRMMILRIVAAAFVAVLIYNLFLIQIIEGQAWSDAADNNRFRHQIQTAPRGKILSADGVELAGSVPSYEVALAYEQNSERRQQSILKLAELLEMDPDDIRDKLSKHRRRFEPTVIASRVDFETVALLEEHRYLIPSLVIEIMPQRVYPQQTLLAHTLGRLVDGAGVEGLELQWDDYLRGQAGYKVVQVNANGSPVGEPMNSLQAIPGHDLHLTIDAGLQQATQDSLSRVLAKIRETNKMEDAWAGAVAVVDPNTGRILAMVTEPSFDNNQKYNYKWPEELPQWARSYRDRVINWRQPVGSTIKMLTGLAGLETGHVTASERIRDNGNTRIANFPVVNWGGNSYGNIDLRRALQVSSNIFFGTVGFRMGREVFYQYVDRFGMTGVASGDIPDYAMKNAGFTDIAQTEQLYSLDYYRVLLNRPSQPFLPSHTVQMSYGQLNEFTVMQMANYVSMLANGGTHYKPYMIEKITDADGDVVEFFEPVVISEQDFDPEYLKVIREGMQMAASSGSHFRNLPIKIAGKTGTAEVRPKDSMAWWVGFAPYENPEIAIVVLVEHGGLGSRASEVGRDIIDYYFNRD